MWRACNYTWVWYYWLPPIIHIWSLWQWYRSSSFWVSRHQTCLSSFSAAVDAGPTAVGRSYRWELDIHWSLDAVHPCNNSASELGLWWVCHFCHDPWLSIHTYYIIYTSSDPIFGTNHSPSYPNPKSSSHLAHAASMHQLAARTTHLFYYWSYPRAGRPLDSQN